MGDLLTKRGSQLSIALENSYAVDPGSGYKQIEIIDCNPKRDRERLEREIIRNTFDKPAAKPGNESATFDISVELHGSGTNGTAPETDTLWLCAAGRKRVIAASLSITGTNSPTFTELSVASGGTAFAVNDLVLVVAGDGSAAEVGRVTIVTSTKITLSASLTATPVGKLVKGGVQYQLKLATDSTLQALPSFFSQFLRGGKILEKINGGKVNQLAMEFTSGQIVKPTFSVEAKYFSSITAGTLTGAPTDTLIPPHIARYMKVNLGAAGCYGASAVAFNLANELYRQLSVCTAGTQNLIRTGRGVTGSLSLLYDEDYVTFETAWDNETLAELMMVSSAGNAALVQGNIFAACIPQIKYLDIPKTEDSGIYKLDIAWEAQYVNGEDTLFLAFL